MCLRPVSNSDFEIFTHATGLVQDNCTTIFCFCNVWRFQMAKLDLKVKNEKFKKEVLFLYTTSSSWKNYWKQRYSFASGILCPNIDYVTLSYRLSMWGWCQLTHSVNTCKWSSKLPVLAFWSLPKPLVILFQCFFTQQYPLNYYNALLNLLAETT